THTLSVTTIKLLRFIAYRGLLQFQPEFPVALAQSQQPCVGSKIMQANPRPDDPCRHSVFRSDKVSAEKALLHPVVTARQHHVHFRRRHRLFDRNHFHRMLSGRRAGVRLLSQTKETEAACSQYRRGAEIYDRSKNRYSFTSSCRLLCSTFRMPFAAGAMAFHR